MCITQPDLCPHDYEQISSLFVRIQVSDSGKPSAHGRFWLEIKLIDENDPPENLQLDQNMINEHSPIGTLIGSFSVQDQDLSQIQTYQILEEDPMSSEGSLFFIEDNNLRLARVPDYEQVQFILISVQATDSGEPPKSVRFIKKKRKEKRSFRFRLSVIFSLKSSISMNYPKHLLLFQIRSLPCRTKRLKI